MTGIADFLDVMANTVTVQKLVSRDRYGAASYGSPNTYPARVVKKTHNVLGPENQVILANGIAWVGTCEPIGIDDLVTLEDGSTPKILKVDAVPDETGAVLYTRLDFQ